MKLDLKEIRGQIRVTKVTCSRTLRSRNGGDVFVSLSSDLNGEEGVDIKSARVAANMLSLEADIACHEAIYGAGVISEETLNENIDGLKSRYSKILKPKQEP